MSSQSQFLFGEPPEALSSVPARGARAHGPVNRKQRAFNTLLAKVERLRRSCEKQERELEAALAFHTAHVAPRRRRLVEQRTALLRELRPFLRDRRVKAADRRVLADVLRQQLEWVFEHSDERPAADIAALFEELHGVALADLEQAQLDVAREDIAEFCAAMGLDVDLPEWSAEMSPEEIAASAADFAARMERQLGEADAHAHAQTRAEPRRNTKRERRKAEQLQRLEQARRNSIGVVYKRLAKALHPDLEQDPAARETKNALMQQVTTAYETRDFHTLLRLEAEWIHAEAGDPRTLGAETLDAYTMMLKQQVAELEAEWFELPLHPRYADITVDAPFGPTILDGAAEVELLDREAAHLDEALARMGAGDGLEWVRALVLAARDARPRSKRGVRDRRAPAPRAGGRPRRRP